MSNKATNFTEVQNLRQWLGGVLGDDKHLYRKVAEGVDDVVCYNVALIWDGTNYHISYTDTDVITSETKTYVLPFTYTDEIVWYIK